MANAFNHISLRAVIDAVSARFPQLLPWVLWCYRNPSDLLLGAEDPLQSPEGAQQADPLDPLLFAFAIHPPLFTSVPPCWISWYFTWTMAS